ncbi:MAG: helix-turn-helix domain-containing protein, partial [Actinomycetota bacterium]|nr:helix-turn-helix domain-containing protein [Actinomycetota bacterium]
VGKRIVLMDPEFRSRAGSGRDEELPELEWDRCDPSVDRLIRALRAQRRPLRVPSVPGSSLAQDCLVTPIVIGEDTLGYLLVLEDGGQAQPDDVDLLTATYAATLFALTLAHERTSTELGLRHLRTTVDALVSGHFLDAEDAREKARSLGLPESTGYRICVVRRQSGLPLGAGDHGVDGLLVNLSTRLPEAKATVRDFGVVAIVPDRLPGRRRGGEAGTVGDGQVWLDIWQDLSLDSTWTCGLSQPLERAELAPLGYGQAEQAVDLGVRLGRGGQLIDYHELGIYRLLLRIADMGQLWRFADEILGSLINYDAAHGGELVRTLSVYLRNQSSPKQTARALRVHANTVAYRAARIEKITGLDLTDPDDRLLAQVALTIVASHMGQDSST